MSYLCICQQPDNSDLYGPASSGRGYELSYSDYVWRGVRGGGEGTSVQVRDKAQGWRGFKNATTSWKTKQCEDMYAEVYLNFTKS